MSKPHPLDDGSTEWCKNYQNIKILARAILGCYELTSKQKIEVLGDMLEKPWHFTGEFRAAASAPQGWECDSPFYPSWKREDGKCRVVYCIEYERDEYSNALPPWVVFIDGKEMRERYDDVEDALGACGVFEDDPCWKILGVHPNV